MAKRRRNWHEPSFVKCSSYFSVDFFSIFKITHSWFQPARQARSATDVPWGEWHGTACFWHWKIARTNQRSLVDHLSGASVLDLQQRRSQNTPEWRKSAESFILSKYPKQSGHKSAKELFKQVKLAYAAEKSFKTGRSANWDKSKRSRKTAEAAKTRTSKTTRKRRGYFGFSVEEINACWVQYKSSETTTEEDRNVKRDKKIKEGRRDESKKTAKLDSSESVKNRHASATPAKR